jgi:hypothetical protein
MEKLIFEAREERNSYVNVIKTLSWNLNFSGMHPTCITSGSC